MSFLKQNVERISSKFCSKLREIYFEGLINTDFDYEENALTENGRKKLANFEDALIDFESALTREIYTALKNQKEYCLHSIRPDANVNSLAIEFLGDSLDVFSRGYNVVIDCDQNKAKVELWATNSPLQFHSTILKIDNMSEPSLER